MSTLGSTVLSTVIGTVTTTVVSEGFVGDWTPMQLFASGEKGFYWDGVNGETYSDAAGTLPAVNQGMVRSFRNLVGNEDLASQGNTSTDYVDNVSFPYIKHASTAVGLQFIAQNFENFTRPWTIIQASSSNTTATFGSRYGTSVITAGQRGSIGLDGNDLKVVSQNVVQQPQTTLALNELHVSSLLFPFGGNASQPYWLNGVEQPGITINALPSDTTSGSFIAIDGMRSNYFDHGMIIINRALTNAEQVLLNAYWQGLYDAEVMIAENGIDRMLSEGGIDFLVGDEAAPL